MSSLTASIATLNVNDRILPGIEIPSDPTIVGIANPHLPTPEATASWNDLRSFTRQTLENFGKGDQRGMLYVHSLEDIMGVVPFFTQKWNQEHPNDQRNEPNEITEAFTPEEFVDHYIPYILAHRPCISGSVVAFHNEAYRNLSSTFAPVSFIFEVPAECVLLTDRQDAGTTVVYSDQPNSGAIYNENRLKAKLNTVDSLVKFPRYRAAENKFNIMNEVAITSCAIDEKKEFFRPKIVGVFLNNETNFIAEVSCGVPVRNPKWKDAAKKFAKINKLPLIEYSQNHTTGVSLETIKLMSIEWAEFTSEEAKKKPGFWNSFYQCPNINLTQTLLDYREKQLEMWNELSKIYNPDNLQSIPRPQGLRKLDEEAERTNRIVREIEEKIWKKIQEKYPLDTENPYEQKDRTFLMNAEQLAGHGLKR